MFCHLLYILYRQAVSFVFPPKCGISYMMENQLPDLSRPKYGNVVKDIYSICNVILYITKAEWPD